MVISGMRPGSSKLGWLWRAPARALGRVRDYYVRSVTGCASYVPSDGAYGSYPVFVPAPLPRSYSGGGGSDYWGDGDSDDLRELIRAASQRRDGDLQAGQAVPVPVATRSQSTAGLSAMARIDEDAPYEFDAGVGGALYPRSQSCVGGAYGRRSRSHRKVAEALG